MKVLKQVLGELCHLFVDDGMLAVLLVVWTAFTGLVVSLLADGTSWTGVMLLAGCLSILAENALRAARNSR